MELFSDLIISKYYKSLIKRKLVEVAVALIVITCMFIAAFIPLSANAYEENKMYLILENQEQPTIKINSTFCLINNDEKYTAITKSSLDEWSTMINENTSLVWNYVLFTNQNYLSNCDVTIQFSEKASLIENYDYFGMTREIDTKPTINIFTSDYTSNKLQKDEVSLFRVVKHEIGHALHLGHSSKGSIMSLNPIDTNVTKNDVQNFALIYTEKMSLGSEKIAIYDLNNMDKKSESFTIKKNDKLTTRLVLSKTIPLEKANLEFNNVKISFEKGTEIKVFDGNNGIDNITTSLDIKNSVNVIRINFTVLKSMSLSDIEIKLDGVTSTTKNYKIKNAIQVL